MIRVGANLASGLIWIRFTNKDVATAENLARVIGRPPKIGHQCVVHLFDSAKEKELAFNIIRRLVGKHLAKRHIDFINDLLRNT